MWTGTELIVSGLTGAAPDGNLLESTEVTLSYNPATHAWRRLAAAPPKTDNYCRRGAVWTGKEMLVWGCGFVAFDPVTNHWRRLSDPPARQGIVVWTGREMIGWGVTASTLTNANLLRARAIAEAWDELLSELPVQDRDAAYFLERQLKGWSRAKKEAFMRGDWERLPMLARNRQVPIHPSTSSG